MKKAGIYFSIFFIFVAGIYLTFSAYYAEDNVDELKPAETTEDFYPPLSIITEETSANVTNVAETNAPTSKDKEKPQEALTAVSPQEATTTEVAEAPEEEVEGKAKEKEEIVEAKEEVTEPKEKEEATTAEVTEEKAESTEAESTEVEITATESTGDYLSSYVNEETRKAEAPKEATYQARELLSHEPTILTPNPQLNAKANMAKAKENSHGIKLPEPKKNTSEAKPQQPVKTPEEIAQEKRALIMQTHSDAPLGLYWGINKEQTQTLGFQLKNAARENYTNVYQILNPQQKSATFALVSAIYGNIDKLWCIYAESTLIDDTADASRVLEMYQTYYKALNQKYSNAQQYYTPHSYEEIVEEKQNGEIKQIKKQKKSAIGNANFLSEIQNGKASLYATFNDEKYGITLGIAVNENGKSYFYIDYKDLSLMKQNKSSIQKDILADI